ncbi:hypothetical protein LPB140_08055 [Sphingorhabdus lutea]|uniref:Uncharacterized protein n=1 Tax=Sphingorhabdus lutea TaxID=1913578 RepID=A0A1L3JC94_9SPHN|nr:hypothetical protein [Sphingorhabdus lutea]APG62750.1 hypothetical protein LPB140_08055 [Sphingorhabdus lutea]
MTLTAQLSSPANDWVRDIFGSVARDGSGMAIDKLTQYLNDPDDKHRRHRSLLVGQLHADICHFLNLCHGQQPGVVDYAENKITGDEAKIWAAKAAIGFGKERDLLNQLTIAAGPPARQAGHDMALHLTQDQPKNLAMLASSDRKGCALGCAMGFVADWHIIRDLLNSLSMKFDLPKSELTLPSIAETMEICVIEGNGPALQRAIRFGFEQVCAQQKGFWAIIDARHQQRLNEVLYG